MQTDASARLQPAASGPFAVPALDVCNVLLVFPSFNPNSFWALKDTLEIAQAKAPSPPLGLMTVAAMLPQHWTFRLINCNAEELTDADLDWADMVMTGGMLPQGWSALEVIARAQGRDVPVIVGGPDATSRPQFYAHADFLILGEVEGIMDQFVDAWRRGERKGRLEGVKFQADVTKTPIPRWDLIDFRHYLFMSLQFSRGCPFTCEFCDIIELYGRVPRTKAIDQLLGELDRLYALGYRGHVDFVDDNLIGNKKAIKKFLPQLKAWQERHGYPFMFSTEASLNLSDDPELLAMMREANFFVVFIGIESGDDATLVAMQKKQNTRRSIGDSVHRIYAAGIYAIAGFIVGFDTEQGSVANSMTATIESTAIPIAMCGMLIALPTTQLERRLRKEGRLIDGWDESADACGDQCTAGLNFRTARPRRDILADYKEVLERIYSPKAFFERLTEVTRELDRPKLPVKFDGGHWRRNARVFRRLAVEITLRRPSVAPHFWGWLVRTALTNPRAIEVLLMNVFMFMHVGRFMHYVVSDLERRIAEIDAGHDPEALPQMLADMRAMREEPAAA